MASQRHTPGPGQGVTSTAKGGNNNALSISEHSERLVLERKPSTTSRPPTTIRIIRLYEKPASCLAIFRLLQMMARQLIMHMLFLDVPLAAEDFLAWIKKEAKKEFDAAVDKLSRLSIVQLRQPEAGRSCCSMLSLPKECVEP